MEGVASLDGFEYAMVYRSEESLGVNIEVFDTLSAFVARNIRSKTAWLWKSSGYYYQSMVSNDPNCKQPASMTYE